MVEATFSKIIDYRRLGPLVIAPMQNANVNIVGTIKESIKQQYVTAILKLFRIYNGPYVGFCFHYVICLY